MAELPTGVILDSRGCLPQEMSIEKSPGFSQSISGKLQRTSLYPRGQDLEGFQAVGAGCIDHGIWYLKERGARAISQKNILQHGVDYTTFEEIESPKRVKIHQTILRGVWYGTRITGVLTAKKVKRGRGGVVTGKDVREINGHRRTGILEGIDLC